MNLNEERSAVLKAANDIIDGAKAAGRDLTDAEVTELEAKTAEVQDLDARIQRQVKADQLIQSIGGVGEHEGTPAAGAAKSLGEHFVKSLGGRSLKQPGVFQAPEFKANTDTQSTGTRSLAGGFGPFATEIDREFVLPKRERLMVADLLGQGTISGNAITYPVFGALEGNTGTVAEGGAKHQIHVADPTWATDALCEVAGWFKITDDMAEDLDYVVSEINSTALYDLALREEVSLLRGNGTAPNPSGIMSRSGVQTQNQGTDTVADAIFKAIGKVQTATGFTADAIVMHPGDYEALRLSKDTNGQYYGGGVFTGPYGVGGVLENPPIWGCRTVITTSIPVGSVLVGAFAIAAKVFRKGGIRVESTNSHSDDFTNDKITIRVRERFGLQVKYPAAFVKLTLASAAAAASTAATTTNAAATANTGTAAAAS